MTAASQLATFPVEHPSTGQHAGTTIVLLHGGNVANWMWGPQVAGLADHHLLTPDLPGFGDRHAERWRSLTATAADVATTIRTRAKGGHAHVVGMSLGAMVATHLIADHPDVVTSAMITGAALSGVHGPARLLGRLQVALWDQRWFWGAQARAFRMPAEDRGIFVQHGLSVTKDNTARMLREVYDGGFPAGLAGYRAPLLAIAGERDSAWMHRSLHDLAQVVPHAECRIAPGMHHAWSMEDADLFNDVVRTWVGGSVHPRLKAV